MLSRTDLAQVSIDLATGYKVADTPDSLVSLLTL